MTDLETFKRAYIEAMLWSSTNDDDEPLDANYAMDDLSPEAADRIAEDCGQFYRENLELISADNVVTQYGADAQAGHDFWLTRNGHGAGFWDGDWEPEAGKALTKASKAFGECDPYIGDDGLIYLA